MMTRAKMKMMDYAVLTLGKEKNLYWCSSLLVHFIRNAKYAQVYLVALCSSLFLLEQVIDLLDSLRS